MNDKGEQESPIPPSWMLHLWNNPTHTAENTSAQQTTSQPNFLALLGSILMIFKLRDVSQESDQEANNNEGDEEDFRDSPNHKAVFTSTPKKLGSKLTIPRQFEEFPNGWGLYLEEGFHPSRILIAILVVYLFATLAFDVAWNIEHQSGPQAGLGSFGVASWMVAGFALCISMWFAGVND